MNEPELLLDPAKILTYQNVVKGIQDKSKDKSTKVGAIAFGSGYTILSTGWNGFPRGVNDNILSRHEKPQKYLWTVHAEANVVANAAREGHRLYNSVLFLTSLFPCAPCAGLLINSGVKNIIAPRIARDAPGVNPIWHQHFEISETMFKEVGMVVHYYNKDDLTDIPAKYAELALFYGVSTMEELIRMQSEHVEHLQKKIPKPVDNFPSNYRQG